MNLSLFKKQLLIFAGITVLFAGIGIVAGVLTAQIDRQRYEASPTPFFAYLVEAISNKYHVSRSEAVELIKHANEAAPFPTEVALYNSDEATKLVGKNGSLPEKPFSVTTFGDRDALHFPIRLVRLPGEPADYLAVNYRPRSSPLHRIFNIQSGVMMLSIFLASLFSMALLFYSMRNKAQLAAGIISRLRDGDLGARFPVGKMDEVGKLMGEFNKMADEIQHLVETIRNTEVTRMRRLQELAHDLRTPVASLKNLLEMLQSHRATMPADSQEEILSMSLKEVEYFARLVEDVLFLAQVTEPKYAVVKGNVNLMQLVEDELETLQARYPKINVNTNIDGRLKDVRGDAHLLRRLFRNALENAFSFATSKVEVSLTSKNGHGVVVFVRDDGDGFNEAALAGFGEKRGTRTVSETRGGRLSVGLGSVIMKAIVTVHGGTLAARNRTDRGAEVEFALAPD